MLSQFYQGRKVLVTGGAGFVGSNLVHRLVGLGSKVTVIDSFHPDYGGNEHNFAGIKDRIQLHRASITDRELMKSLAQDADLIFHIAAQCSHVDSMTDPWLDVDYNCVGTLSVLEAAKSSAKKPPVVYAGTRAMVGAPLELPVTEHTLPNPTDIYGVNKLAAELYGSVYARVHKLPFISLRMTNSFGPRHQMKSGKYGILNWFLSLAMQGKTIKVFGTGEQLRDYIYIDDAIETFLLSGEFANRLATKQVQSPSVQLAGPEIPFAVFNISSGQSLKFVDVARKVHALAGGKLEQVAWPADRAAIETGDFVASGAAAREILGWSTKTSFEDGLQKTIAFYKENLNYYL